MPSPVDTAFQIGGKLYRMLCDSQNHCSVSYRTSYNPESLLYTASSEIAFYKGNKKEEQVLQGVFQRLIAVTRRSERFRHSLGVLDSVVAKYFATIVGWTVVSRPFVNLDHPRHADSTPAQVYQGKRPV